MAEVKVNYSNYVRYSLKHDYSGSIEIPEPLGWDDDDFELDRHKDYHGIFTQLSGELKFTGDAMEYINEAYILGGINANCRIIREEQIDHNGDVKWVERYNALARL